MNNSSAERWPRGIQDSRQEPISRWTERFFWCRPSFPSHRASAHSAKEKRIELLVHQQRTHHYCLRPQERSSGPTIMFLSHQYFWKLMACWSGRLALRRHAWGSFVEMTGWGWKIHLVSVCLYSCEKIAETWEFIRSINCTIALEVENSRTGV